MIRLAMVRSLSFLSTCWLVAAATAYGVELPRWKFTTGDENHYVTHRTSDVKLDLSGSVIEFGFDSTFDTKWKVKSVAADGTAELEQTIERLQLKVETPLGGGFDYDSSKPGSGRGITWDAIGSIWESMVGQPFTLRVTPRGKVIEVTLPQKLLAELAKPPSPARLSSMSGVGGDLTAESIKETIERSIVLFPEQLENEHAGWSQLFERKQKVEGNAEILQKRTLQYTLGQEAVRDGNRIREIHRELKLELKPSANAAQDIEVIEQEGKETFEFDMTAGRMIRAQGRHRSVVETTGADRPETTVDRDERFEIRLGKSTDAAENGEIKKK